MIVEDRFSTGDTEEIISFADGRIAEELIPQEAIQAAAASVKTKYGDEVDSGHAEGVQERLASLREMIAERMRKQGMASVTGEDVALTSGLEQSLEWVVRELTVSGDTVLVERPTGSVGLSVLARCGVRIIGVECDEHGVRVEELERLLVGVVQGESESESGSKSEIESEIVGESHAAKKPRLLYVAPTYGDPTGRVWSLERRLAVLALCQAHGVVIIEDDTCGGLKFHTNAANLPTLYELAGEAGGVLYVNSFEHMIGSSLRVGWIAGERAMMARFGVNGGGGLDSSEDAAEVGGGGVSEDSWSSVIYHQLVLAELLRDFDLDAHVKRVADEYRERMYAMQRQLRIHQLGGVKWTEPEGGRSLWLTLPDGLDSAALGRLTRMMGVEIAPSNLFYTEELRRNTVQLYFTSSSMDEIEQGVGIIAEAIQGFTARWSEHS